MSIAPKLSPVQVLVNHQLWVSPELHLKLKLLHFIVKEQSLQILWDLHSLRPVLLVNRLLILNCLRLRLLREHIGALESLPH